MSPDELIKKIQELLRENGYEDHIISFIIPEREGQKAALAMIVHMTRVNALHALTEMADKMPDVFSAVVVNQLGKMRVDVLNQITKGEQADPLKN